MGFIILFILILKLKFGFCGLIKAEGSFSDEMSSRHVSGATGLQKTDADTHGFLLVKFIIRYQKRSHIQPFFNFCPEACYLR